MVEHPNQCQPIPGLGADETLFTHLVPNEHLDYVVIRRVRLELCEPVLDRSKGLAACNVVDEDGALPSPVVARCQRAKSFLSRRVPDRQLNLQRNQET